MNTPIVSVVLATYNGANYLAKAISSVLSQSFRDIELIIIDDASTDPMVSKICTEFIKSDKRVRYFRNQYNLERSVSKNFGVQKSNGRYIAFIDDDDIWCNPSKLAQQIEVFRKDPTVVLVGTAASVCNEYGNIFGDISVRKSDYSIRNIMLLTNPFIQSSVVVDRVAFERVGGYPIGLNLCEDYDLWLRLGVVGKMMNLSESYVCYMVRGSSTTAKNIFRMKTISFRLAWKYHIYYPHKWPAIMVRCMTFFIPILIVVRLTSFIRDVLHCTHKLHKPVK